MGHQSFEPTSSFRKTSTPNTATFPLTSFRTAKLPSNCGEQRISHLTARTSVSNGVCLIKFRVVGQPEVKIFILYRDTNSLFLSVPGQSIGVGSRNGFEQHERAVSGTICAAPAVTNQRKDAVRLRFVSRTRAKHRFWTPVQKLTTVRSKVEAFSSILGPSSTSPQCQRTTDTKYKNLEPLEESLAAGLARIPLDIQGESTTIWLWIS